MGSNSMSASVTTKQKFFGLVELDTDGTVLYSRNETSWGHNYIDNVTGRNFFSEVAPFLNVTAFRQCVDSFNRSSQQADSVAFTCEYEDGPVAVRLLMARVSEESSRDVTKSILIHVRKVE